MTTQETLLEFFQSRRDADAHDSTIDGSLSLCALGILDSLAAVQLIQFIEDKFDVMVATAEVAPDVFETIDGIAELIERKRRARE